VHGEDVVLDPDIDVLLVNSRDFNLQRDVVLVFVDIHGGSEARGGQRVILALVAKRLMKQAISPDPAGCSVRGRDTNGSIRS
jgi:hypothetical protein